MSIFSHISRNLRVNQTGRFWNLTFTRALGYLAGRRIEPNRLSHVSKRVNEVSQKYIAERYLEAGDWEGAKPSEIGQVGENLETGQLLAWRAADIFKPNVGNSGRLKLLNPDKLETFNLAAACTELPVDSNKRVLLVDEGCDNGDILGYAIPWLIRRGNPTAVVLTNGNVEKLSLASRFSNWLLKTEKYPKNEATSLLHNAFTGPSLYSSPTEDIQKIYLLYHLGIVERPQVVSTMVSRRVKTMSAHDIGLLTLLKNDPETEAKLSSGAAYKVYESGVEGAFTCKRRVTKKTVERLKSLGVTNEDDHFNYLTAFTPAAATKLIEESGAEIVHGHSTRTVTEDGIEKTVMGFVFKKAEE